MSYQQGQNINQYIPNYVTRSDYLPTTRVVEGTNTQTSQLVCSILSPASSIWGVEKEGKSLHPTPCWIWSQPLCFLQSSRDSQNWSTLDEHHFSRVARRWSIHPNLPIHPYIHSMYILFQLNTGNTLAYRWQRTGNLGWRFKINI